MGDPAGVGPEVLLRALANETRPVRVYGDPAWLGAEARALGLPMAFPVEAVARVPADLERGRGSDIGARAQVDCLRVAAAELAAGRIAGLVTGPIHKRALAECGEVGPGQTEWLARRLGARLPVMMLCGPRLRVMLATTHLPLRQVPGALRADSLCDTVRVGAAELRRYFLERPPRLALAALNPHGEEDGRPGREEQEILAPVVETLRREGLDILGPLPADSLFALAAGGRFDAVVALYHDQGLAPLKALGFFDAVNVTLGLGYVRTSPDHGVAYDLAGRGQADPRSMRAAIDTAFAMIARREREATP
ncbi:MAG: 4-hydroxythreonine-4-phosphate dehydrogenase PdxA [Myxococcales bacterium]|nr:4-hydroxythreonine-4-phosphate dehydrogenase PdxA [Myxococcales bacterium]